MDEKTRHSLHTCVKVCVYVDDVTSALDKPNCTFAFEREYAADGEQDNLMIGQMSATT